MYELTFQPEADYLRAIVQGDFEWPETRLAAWTEIIQRCKEDDDKRLLIVQNSPCKGTMLEAHAFAVAVGKIGVAGIKIAFVDLNLANQEANKFEELVGENRGAHAKVFTEKNSAIEWLTKGSSPALP